MAIWESEKKLRHLYRGSNSTERAFHMRRGEKGYPVSGMPYRASGVAEAGPSGVASGAESERSTRPSDSEGVGGVDCVNAVCTGLHCARECSPHTVLRKECRRIEELEDADIGHVYSTLGDCLLRKRATHSSMWDTLNQVVEQFETKLFHGSKLRIVEERADFVRGPYPRLSDHLRFSMATPHGRYYNMSSYLGAVNEHRRQLTTQRFDIGEVVEVSGSHLSHCVVGNRKRGFTLKFQFSYKALSDMFEGDGVELHDRDGHKYTAVYELPESSYIDDAWSFVFENEGSPQSPRSPTHDASPSSLDVDDHDGRRNYLAYLRSLYHEYMRRPFSELQASRGLLRLVQRRKTTFRNARAKLRLVHPSRKKRLHEAALTQKMAQKGAATQEMTALAERIGTAAAQGQNSDVLKFVEELTAVQKRIEDMDAVLLVLSKYERSADDHLLRAALGSELIRAGHGERARLSERIAQVQQQNADSRAALKRKYEDEAYAADLRYKDAAKENARKRLKSVFTRVRLQTMASRMCHRYEAHLHAQERAAQAQAEAMREAFDASRLRLQDEFESREASTSQAHRLELQEHKSALSELINRPLTAISEQVQKYATQYTCLACYESTPFLTNMAIPSCNCMHGLCKDCFPLYVSVVIDNVTPQTFEEAFVPCYDAKENQGACNGQYSFANAVTCCDGILKKSRRGEAGGSTEAMDVASELERWALAGHARALLKEFIAKTNADNVRRIEITEAFRDTMRAEGWLPDRPLENRVYQCPRCGYGPVTHAHCFDLAAHHNEVARNPRGAQSAYNNACPECNWFSREPRDWAVWSGNPPATLFSDM